MEDEKSVTIPGGITGVTGVPRPVSGLNHNIRKII
jgi:hypothetical protein